MCAGAFRQVIRACTNSYSLHSGRRRVRSGVQKLNAASDVMKTTLLVTTINAANAAMTALAQACQQADASFVVVGDKKTPDDFSLPGAEYLSLSIQFERFGEFARLLPLNHYVRKNLGYLAALEAGSHWLVETDDDNFPLANFLSPPVRQTNGTLYRAAKRWANVYAQFAPSAEIWPRGLPLDAVLDPPPLKVGQAEVESVIVQGLADEDPDVDAIFRLTRNLPVHFDPQAGAVALEAQSWCPFNSQNTWIRRDFAVLAYLPTHCTFRMTDIWRSLVAQRCLWAAGHKLLFTAPSVRQVRNEHDLMRDFADEIPGYLYNERIAEVLTEAELTGEPAFDLRNCYAALVAANLIDVAELDIVDPWIREVRART